MIGRREEEKGRCGDEFVELVLMYLTTIDGTTDRQERVGNSSPGTYNHVARFLLLVTEISRSLPDIRLRGAQNFIAFRVGSSDPSTLPQQNF